MRFLPRETVPTQAAFIAAGESARSLLQDRDESNKAYWERVGRAAVDAYRSATDPKPDAKRILNLLLPFAESVERNGDFAAVARETSHFVRDLSLFSDFSDRLSYFSCREGRDYVEPRLPTYSPGIEDDPLPKLKPTSIGANEAVKIATVVAFLALGIAAIVYWSQIEAVLNLA